MDAIVSRFPEDFMFQIIESEPGQLVSQNVIPHKKYFGGHDRELLECPNCDLTEDVSSVGLLFTFHRSRTDLGTDSGLQSSILNEKVGTVSAQLALNLEKLLNNLLKMSHGFCFEVRMSECVKNVGRVYREGHKSLSKCYPVYGLREQIARILDEIITRNRKELGYVR